MNDSHFPPSGELPTRLEFLQVLDDCDLRLSNVDTEGLHTRLSAIVLLGSACIEALDVQQRTVEVQLWPFAAVRRQKLSRQPPRPLRLKGQVTGWADRRVRPGCVAPEDDDPMIPGFPGARISADPSSFVVVDFGVVSLVDYAGFDASLSRFDGDLQRCIWIFLHDLRNQEFGLVWQSEASKTVMDEAIFVDNTVGSAESLAFQQAVDALRASQETPFFRPHSNEVARDLVHPDLYPYLAKESPFCASGDLPDPKQAPRIWRPDLESVPHRGKLQDMWMRSDTASRYDRLPTYFSVSDAGDVSIDGHISGIDRSVHVELYERLAGLFRLSLPLLEHAWTQGRLTVFHEDQHDWKNESRGAPKTQLVLDVLTGKRLQVFTQIVDYDLQAGQELEDDWHLDGMSYENVVATAVYVAARDGHIDGANVEARRGWNLDEGRGLWERYQGEGADFLDCFNDEDDDVTVLIPLGQLQMVENRILALPNTHVRRLTKMKNVGKRPAKLRTVAFSLVNPHVRIISTQEVPDQAATTPPGKVQTRRLELLADRSAQDWNVRSTSGIMMIN